jgi:hypothetical protein
MDNTDGTFTLYNYAQAYTNTLLESSRHVTSEGITDSGFLSNIRLSAKQAAQPIFKLNLRNTSLVPRKWKRLVPSERS